MIAIDTNVLLRLIVRDDAKQTFIAEKTLDHAREAFYINILVLCETLGVLRKAYEFNKQQLIEITKILAKSDDFFMQDEGMVNHALELAERCAATVPDILIGLMNEKAGCKTTLTFDKQAAKLENFTLLS